ncbi:MAG: hypothetical protein ACFFB3_10005 [Candidatus Hodarchaeota archaeon]
MGTVTLAEPDVATVHHLAGFQEAIQYYDRVLEVPSVHLTPDHLLNLIRIQALMLTDLSGEQKYCQVFEGIAADYAVHTQLLATRVALARQQQTLPPWDDLIVDTQGHLTFVGQTTLLLVFVSNPLSPPFQKTLRRFHQTAEQLFADLLEREKTGYLQLVEKLAERMLAVELLEKPLLLTNRALIRELDVGGMDGYYALDLLYNYYEPRLESQGFPLKFLITDLPQKHLGLNQQKLVECLYALLENGYLILEEPRKL